MNVLDENIVAPERDKLRDRKIHYRRIGGELGWAGMKDRNEVLPLLHTLRRPTFFTRDRDYYQTDLCHAGYCLVYLDVAFDEVATISIASCTTKPSAPRRCAWVKSRCFHWSSSDMPDTAQSDRKAYWIESHTSVKRDRLYVRCVGRHLFTLDNLA